MGVIQIQIDTPITEETIEKLKDAFKEILEEQGLSGHIFDNVNFNTSRFGNIYVKQLKKPDDIIEVHQALENMLGE